MTPDDLDARLGRLEMSMARLEQQVSTHETDIRAIGPMAVTIAKLELSFTHIEAELRGARGDTAACRDEVKDLKSSLLDREQTQRKERKADRRWLIGTVLTSAALVIGAIQVLGGFG